jgi:hypothetical protein
LNPLFLLQIIDVLEITLQYSVLHNSKIEGIDVYATKFTNMFTKLSSQKYKELDHRSPEFNNDYVLFKQDVSDTEAELQDFLAQCFSQVPNVSEALRLLKR